jgi:hypothetical protein
VGDGSGVRLELSLPGRWFAMPLRQPDAAERIRGLAEELLGTADRRAGARIGMRRRLAAALERAEAGGAEQLHLGLALETDVPMPATASVYPAVAVTTAASADPDAVLAALVPLVLRAAHEPHGGTATPGEHDRVLVSAGSRILRRPSVREAGDREASLPALAVDYWLTVPGRREAVLLHLDVPLLASAPLLLGLCDAIAMAARFARAEGPAAGLRHSHATRA